MPGPLYSTHLGVTHLPLNQEPHLLLHAAVVADGELPQNTERKAAATMSWLAFGILTRRFLAQCTRQGCQPQPWKHRTIAF